MEIDNAIDPRIQKMVDIEIPALDILHGELKILLVEAEAQLEEASRTEIENDYDDAMESMERKYWEGQCDALNNLYRLTYQLYFAIEDRNKK